MFNRYLNLLMASCLALLIIAGVGAQSNDQGIDYCAIVSEADCQILEMNESAMWELSSSAMTFTATGVTRESGAEGSAQTGSIDIDGYLRLSYDLEAMKDWTAINADTTLEERALILDRALVSTTGEFSMNMVSISSDGVEELSINLLMDDGVFVVDGATFESLTGESMGGVEWLGLDLKGAMETIMQMPDFESTVDITPMPGVNDMEGLEEALTVTRLPDSEVNGVAVAVFNYDVDFPILLETLGELSMMEEMSTSDAVMLAMSVRMLSDMMAESKLSAQSYVGLDDYYTHRAVMAFDIEMDGDDAGFGDIGNITLEMDMSIDFSDHGEPITVDLPEDAFVFPLIMLLQMSE